MSVTSLETSPAELSWGPLAIAVAVGVPLTIVANATEFLLSSRLLGQQLSFRTALGVSVTATAANLLPLPGGILVRIQGLRREGAAASGALVATAGPGLVWVALSTGLVAVVLALRSQVTPALFAAGGFVVTAGAAWALIQRTRPSSRLVVRIVATEVLSIAAGAFRIHLLLISLNVAVEASQSLVLASAAALSMAVAIVPAGLGIKEGLTSGLAVLVALPASAGFVVSVLDRVVGLVIHGLLAVLLGLNHQRGERT